MLKPVLKLEHRLNPIRNIFLAFIIFINFSALYSFLESLLNISKWSDKTLIGLFLIYIFYRQIKQTKFIYQPTYSVRFLLLAIFSNLLGYLSDFSIFMWLGVGLSVYSFLLYFYGRKTANSFQVSLFLLVFLARINSPTALGFLSLSLRLAATKIAGLLLSLIQIKTIAQGAYLSTSKIVCSIDEACSGLNNIFSLTFLAFIYSYFKRYSLLNSAFLGGIAFVLAFSANVLRIFLLTLCGHFWGKALIAPGTIFHNLIGIICFLSALGLLYWLDNKYFLKKKPAKKTKK